MYIAFSDYASVIEETTDALLTRIENSEKEEIQINKLCADYGFDMMTTISFGDSTHFLDGTATKRATKILKSGKRSSLMYGIASQTPWLGAALGTLFFFPRWLKGHNGYTLDVLKKRQAKQDPKPDIVGHFFKNPEGSKLLLAESKLLLNAGAETTSSALNIFFILLAIHPQYQSALRKQVSAAIKDGSYSCGKGQPLLEDFIAESLRMFSPVLLNTQRIIPEDGVKIGKVEIPEDTVVNFATYQIQRGEFLKLKMEIIINRSIDPRNFVRPNEFIPERWSSQPELVLNSKAFIPFSTGSSSPSYFL